MFDGSGSTCLDAPCTYTWTDQPPGGGIYPLGSGSTLGFSFESAGTKYVNLVVSDADGDMSRMVSSVDVATSVAPPPPPPPPPLPLPSVGTACTDTAGPSTLVSKIAAAPAGATLCLASGSYSYFTINDQRRTSYLTIRAGDGQSPVVAGFTITNSSYIRIQGLRVTDGWGVRIANNLDIVGNDFDGSHGNVRALKHSTIRDNQIHDIQSSGDEYVGAGIWINSYAATGALGPTNPLNGLDGLVIKGNSFRSICSDALQIGGGDDNGTKNVTIDGNDFFDIAGRCDPTAHSDAIQMIGGRDMTVRNNRFEQVQNACMWKDDRLEGTTLVENNLMIASSNTYGGTGIMCQIWDAANLVFRNNTVIKPVSCCYQSLMFRTMMSGSKTAVVENNALSEGFYAEPGWTTTSRNNVTGMSIASMFDSVWTAMPGSALVDAANANAPATDRLGRPRVGAPDVGAQELQ